MAVLPLPVWIPAPYRRTGHAFDRWNGELGGGDPFSYQSLMPALAGTPRYENWVHWLMGEFRRRLCPPTHALGWGQAPALHFCLPAGNEPQLEEVSWPIIRASERYIKSRAATCVSVVTVIFAPRRVLPATKRQRFSLTETMCPGGDLCVNETLGSIVISVKSDSVSRRWLQPDGGTVEAVP